MNSLLTRIMRATLWVAVIASPLTAQVYISGTVSGSAGGTLLRGDRAAFQAQSMHQKDGFGGLEELQFVREVEDTILTIKARAMVGDENYGLRLKFEKFDAYYIDAGYSQFRTYYDADGGYIPTDGLWLPVISDITATDRSKLWLELGYTPEDQPHWVFRYQRDTRSGTKGSTHWGDSSLSVAGSKYIVPTFYDLDEVRDTLTLDASDVADDTSWKAGVRYQTTELNNLKNTRRRPFESADRYLTTSDETSNDLFAAHGYVEHKLSEQLRFSMGAIHTTLDTQLDGTRIFGSNGYDPVFSPDYATRQQRDEGYYNLSGDNQLKQNVANLNFVYTPAPGWKIMPTVRVEDLRVDSMSEFIETAVGGGGARPMAEEEFGAESSKDWQEISGRLEARYTGIPKWTHTLRAEWLKGDGELMEELIDRHTGSVDIDRDTQLERTTHQYTYTANWYAQPGITFATQAYYRLRINDFANLRDSTPAGMSDRYPAYVIGQDFETTDFNVRLTWRPSSNMTLITRYDIQDNSVVTTEAGFTKAKSSELLSRVFSQSFTWLPTPRYYVMGTVNVVTDKLTTPAAALILDGNNAYTYVTMTGGMVVSEQSDLLMDLSRSSAHNYVDSSALTVPYLSGFDQTRVALTWIYRATENLVYHFRYSYAENNDELVGGFSDYQAHTFYAKVQHKF